MNTVDYNYFGENDFNNLQMNIMYLQYQSMSQSGTFDYIFDSIDIENYSPKIKIIKRNTPNSRSKTTSSIKENSPISS